MPTALLAALEALMSNLPTLMTEGATLWESVAHGEGGALKVATAASNLATLAATAAQTAAAVHPAAVGVPAATAS